MLKIKNLKRKRLVLVKKYTFIKILKDYLMIIQAQEIIILIKYKLNKDLIKLIINFGLKNI